VEFNVGSPAPDASESEYLQNAYESCTSKLFIASLAAI